MSPSLNFDMIRGHARVVVLKAVRDLAPPCWQMGRAPDAMSGEGEFLPVAFHANGAIGGLSRLY